VNSSHVSTSPAISLLSIRNFARYASLFVLLVEVLFFWSQRPSFFTWDNLHIIFNNSALLGLVAGGLTICLIVGDFDLSIAGAIGLGGVVAGSIVENNQSTANIVLAVALGLLVGIAIGLFNGLVVTGLGVNAFVATLGSGALLEGIIIAVTDGGKTLLLRGRFQKIAITEYPNFSWFHPRMMTWVMLLVLAALAFMVARTVAGRRLEAVGGNAQAARLSGISVSRYRIFAFTISGVLAALTGVLLAARSGSANATAGAPFLLEAYTAAFLGAVTIRNSEFHVWGTLFGVVFLKTTFSGISIMGWPPFWNPIATGVLLIFAVGASGVVIKYINK